MLAAIRGQTLTADVCPPAAAPNLRLLPHMHAYACVTVIAVRTAH